MEKTLVAHKIELRPTHSQEQFLKQSVGIARKAWNELLGHFKESKDWSRDNAQNELKRIRTEFPFFKDVSSRTSRNVVQDLDAAYSRFFKKISSFPKFKKKSHGGSFGIRDKEKFLIEGRSLRIERLKTRIKTREKLRFSGITKHCTISYKAGKWFASIMVELDETPSHWNQNTFTRKPSVGVDLGVKELAVLSDGTRYEANQPLKKQLKKLARLQKKLARQVKGSNRRMKTLLRIQKLHYYVSCRRKAVLHEITDHLTRSYNRIVIEDLNVSGMTKNHKLARAVSDCGFYEFRRQLEYKSFFRGNELIVADRWFPSSQICSTCGCRGSKKELSVRSWKCDDCGATHDRDLNAALNLNRYSPDTIKRDSNMHKREV